MAEDCLFAAVYAPANATETSMLPIMMFISGGGFTSNSNGNFNGTGLVEASGMNMIVVRANYRVGMLGFLAGTMVENDRNGAVSNNGLKEYVPPLYPSSHPIHRPESMQVQVLTMGILPVWWLLPAG